MVPCRGIITDEFDPGGVPLLWRTHPSEATFTPSQVEGKSLRAVQPLTAAEAIFIRKSGFLVVPPQRPPS
jgi:hypothetical protein